MKNITLIGGGHCNCQVLKMLKKEINHHGLKAKMTLINEAPRSYYSGMLPGAVSSIPIFFILTSFYRALH
jgi:NADH dehydrogenase FAD-containing subunit